MRISFEKAVLLLQRGEVVALPTETVYGLAARLEDPKAIEKVFALKNRPRLNPLIIHIANWQTINDYVTNTPPDFDKLVNAFWPGPLTLILPINSKVPSIASATLPTAGFRLPASLLTRELIEKTGPLVMPSANVSGRPSGTKPEHIEEDFGIEFPVLDGGMCSKGVESTILLYQNDQWMIARLGALSGDQFIKVLGYEPMVIQKEFGAQPLCPGQLFRHYAPRARLILGDSGGLSEAPFILGFKERSYPINKRLIILGSLSSPEEVAENLYHALRQLDYEEAAVAWVDMHFPRFGLWQTIAERLTRAGEI